MFVALIWFVTLFGFVPDVMANNHMRSFGYSIAVHVHAAFSKAAHLDDDVARYPTYR